MPASDYEQKSKVVGRRWEIGAVEIITEIEEEDNEKNRRLQHIKVGLSVWNVPYELKLCKRFKLNPSATLYYFLYSKPRLIGTPWLSSKFENSYS